MLLTWVEIS